MRHLNTTSTYLQYHPFGEEYVGKGMALGPALEMGQSNASRAQENATETASSNTLELIWPLTAQACGKT